MSYTHLPFSAAKAWAPIHTFDCITAIEYSGTNLELVVATQGGLWPTSAQWGRKGKKNPYSNKRELTYVNV